MSFSSSRACHTFLALAALLLLLVAACSTGGDVPATAPGVGSDGGATPDATTSSSDGAALDGAADGGAGKADGAGSAPQAGCATNSDCAAGLVCGGHHCIPAPAMCSPEHDACGSAGDCCPGLSCSAGTCNVCRPSRMACKADGDCCSGYCRGGYCGAVPDAATCKPLSFDCGGDVDKCCTSSSACRAPDNALASQICCRIAGDTCSSKSDCCGQMPCTGGHCRVVELGGTCADHSDCASGLQCIDGKCDTGQCHGYQQRCDTYAADGKGCCPGMECFSPSGADVCVLQLGSGLCKGGGEACQLDDECCFPGVCSGGTCHDYVSCAFPGATCTSGGDCCSGTCAGGRCTSVTPSCNDAGSLCGGTWGGCCSGSTCTQGRCAATGAPACRADGAACTGAADCCTGYCTKGACGAGGTPACLANGASCSVGSACCSGRCASGAPGTSGPVCLPNTPACAGSGGACSVGADCCSGFTCASGKCAVAAGTCEGSTCSVNGGGGACCEAAPYCTGTGSTTACSSTCGTHYMSCDTMRDCCAGLICQNHQCQNATSCAGKACTSSAGCCDTDTFCVNGQCASACGADGAKCSSSFDCCGGQCTGGVCGKAPAGGSCLPAGNWECTAGLGSCCASAPYCGSEGPGAEQRCRAECSPKLGAASKSSDCCPGLTLGPLGWCN